MPDIFVDYPQPDTEQPHSLSGQTTDGNSFDSLGYTIQIVIPVTEVDAWLQLYQPTNQYSPSATDSRKIARIVLDALASIVA